MWPDRVSNPGPLTYESGALPTALRGPAILGEDSRYFDKITWPRGYKTFFMLNSAEYDILNARKCKNIKKFSLFQAQISQECYFSAHKC